MEYEVVKEKTEFEKIGYLEPHVFAPHFIPPIPYEWVSDLTEMRRIIREEVREELLKEIGSRPVVIEEISFKDAKEEIANFLKDHSNKRYYPSELVEILKIDLDTILRAQKELEKEGKIK